MGKKCVWNLVSLFFYEAIFLLLFFTWIKLIADFFMSDKKLKKVFGKSE